MNNSRKELYVDDLLEIIKIFDKRINEIKQKITNDEIINQGLFLMSSSILEDSIRSIIRTILISFPDKLDKKSYQISREDICEISVNGFEIIIDSALFRLFKGGVKNQLFYVFYIISNLDEKHLPKSTKELIQKCEEISLYRNVLIHNGGKPTKLLVNNARIYKPLNNYPIIFDQKLIHNFLDDYKLLLRLMEIEILKSFKNFRPVSKIGKLKKLWDTCFNSPLLHFDDYWHYNVEKDLIIDVKFTDYEESLSSGESVLLSIWRNQFNDIYKPKNFIVLSIDYNKIHEMYKVFYEIKFYHMHQKANPMDFD